MRATPMSDTDETPGCDGLCAWLCEGRLSFKRHVQTRGRGATSDVYTTLKHDFGDSDTVTVDRSRVSDL